MQVIDWSQKFDFGGPRPLSAIQAIYIHTTENAPGTPAENVANYQLTSRSGSYHRLADRTKILIENTDDWTTWSTANKANWNGLHLSFVARAAMTRNQWLDETKMLNNGAVEVAKWCKKYNIAPTFTPAKDLLAGRRGISTHDEARKAWGVTDHTDPGPNFPWPEFLQLVTHHMQTPTNPTPPKESPEMTYQRIAPNEQINRIHHEVTHKFGSRVEGSQFRDTLIGYVLEMDRKIEDIHKALPEILEALKGDAAK